MTVVRFKNRPNGVASFNNLLSDVFPQMPSLYRDEFKYSIPVNIKETQSEYLIELVAPGLTKENFGINLDDNTLTISADKKEEIKTEGEKIIRNEYKFTSFKRSFTLDDKVNIEGIKAEYINGVLSLSLPKKEEVKPSSKQIIVN